MTIKELSQLYWLNREIEMDQKRLEELEWSAIPGSPTISDMPPGPHSNESKVEKLAAEIVDLKAIIAAKQIQCIHERQRLERYIAGIPDSLTRSILQLRFSNGLPWNQVAASIGGGNTTESVKKRCYRYLDNQEKERTIANETDSSI